VLFRSTGKMAGTARTFDAVFRQNNIIPVDDPFELADTAALFEKCPVPRGDRVSVVSFSGGWCGVIADQAETLGIPMADFTDATVERLKPLLDFTPPLNPLDLSGNVNNHPERWDASLQAVLADDNTDILVVFIHQVRAAWRERLIAPLLALAKTATKPILVVYDGGKVVEEGYELLARDRILGWAASYVPDRTWFIQKSIAWWLRDLSKHDADRVRHFLAQHGEAMKPFARKEASKYLNQ